MPGTARVARVCVATCGARGPAAPCGTPGFRSHATYVLSGHELRFQAPRNEEGAATHLLPAPGTILFPLPGRAGEQSWLAAWTRAPAARASPAARPPPRNGDGPPGWGLLGVLCGRRGAASRGSPLPFRAVKAGMVDPHCTSGREPGGPGEVSRGGASHRAGRRASWTDWLGALWCLGKARGLGLGRTWSGTDLVWDGPSHCSVL